MGRTKSLPGVRVDVGEEGLLLVGEHFLEKRGEVSLRKCGGMATARVGMGRGS